jgi:hypothetical protein
LIDGVHGFLLFKLLRGTGPLFPGALPVHLNFLFNNTHEVHMSNKRQGVKKRPHILHFGILLSFIISLLHCLPGRFSRINSGPVHAPKMGMVRLEVR